MDKVIKNTPMFLLDKNIVSILQGVGEMLKIQLSTFSGIR